MRKYRSYKVVEAGLIQEISEDQTKVRVDDEWIDVPSGIFARGMLKVGADFLIRYEDGYLSWSPKKAFREGYSEVIE
jgi:hypothetical protein